MLKFPRPEAPSGIRQLEWPEEVARLLEVWPHGHNLMDQVLHADDTKFAQTILENLVVGQWDTLLVDFAVTALVDQVADCFDRRVAVGDVGFHDFEHFGGCFGDFYENAVVDLK